jgi:hypothetical protein
MPFENWGDTRRALACALDELDDREFLILGEPAPALSSPHRIFHTHVRAVPTRYVQVLRIGDVLSAECVGAASLGGTWEMDPSVIDWLRDMGWLTPAESLATYGSVTPNFGQYAELADLPLLAGILVASLQVLGVFANDLELQTQSGWAAEEIS